jgi:TolB-like protein/Tfp pilus assembly protein PilF
MASIWSELKRRNVVKVAVAYAIVGWLLIEVASTTFPMLRLPDWAATFVTVLLIIGLPVALLLAWAYELTPEGLKKERDVDRSQSITQQTGRKLDFLIIGVLGIAVVYFAVDKFFWAEKSSTVSPALTEQSVAVLPFVNMSADPDQEYFADGIAEELLNDLTKIRGLQVAGRTSSFSFKGQNEDLRVIGEKLDVANVLEGSVRKAGERVRITAQLVKAADGFHLWSETYERDLTDIFAIQDEIARAVASALSIALGVGQGDLSRGGTRNFDAYDAYLAGLPLSRQITPDGTVRAIEYLEKAVTLDPDYAQAWSVLVQTYQNAASLFIADRTEELYEKSEAAARRAVEIAPEAVAPFVAAALVQVRNHDWIQAERSYRKALALAPADYEANLFYGQYLMGVGRPGEAMTYLRQAASTESLIVQPVLQSAVVQEMNGEFDLALKELQRAKGLIGNQGFLDIFILVNRMSVDDRVSIEKALQQVLTAEGVAASTNELNGTMYSLLDAPEAARAALHRFDQDPAFGLEVNRGGIATWAAYFGDPQLALGIYRELLFPGAPGFFFQIWRPLEKDIRRLAGFKDLVRDLGFVDYWRSTGNWGQFCHPVGHADFECE